MSLVMLMSLSLPLGVDLLFQLHCLHLKIAIGFGLKRMSKFNDHDKVSRTIGSNLKSMWSGPWKGWKDVPSHHRERLFERFQEKCIKGKFPDLLKRARDKAKALAIQEGAKVENDLTPILLFKPLWMSQESWETLVHAWNTVSWKSKASQNSDNRGWQAYPWLEELSHG
ncbi:hypothetical protein HanRHA438_Chr09g0390071 [Helianthus annuus]|nr:hypothetical protein HanRHA438_Chr09g0390071 [Helianthus annuus]